MNLEIERRGKRMRENTNRCIDCWQPIHHRAIRCESCKVERSDKLEQIITRHKQGIHTLQSLGELWRTLES